jgi:hypothetical protein
MQRRRFCLGGHSPGARSSRRCRWLDSSAVCRPPTTPVRVDAIVTDAIAVPALKQATAGRVYRGGMTPSEFQAHLLEQVKDILSKLSIFR